MYTWRQSRYGEKHTDRRRKRLTKIRHTTERDRRSMKRQRQGTSLVVRRLRFRASYAGGAGLILVRELKSHML